MHELHNACAKGDFKLVKQLILQGKDVNEPDGNNLTPLFYAVKANNRKIFNFLVTNGAHTKPLIDAACLIKSEKIANYPLCQFIEEYIENLVADFEKIPHKTQAQLRHYRQALEDKLQLKQYKKIDSDLLILASKCYLVSREIKAENETDYIKVSIDAATLADIYQAFGQHQCAQQLYLESSSYLPEIKNNGAFINIQSLNIFNKLKKMPHLSELEKQLYSLSADCFQPDAKIENELQDILNVILNQQNDINIHLYNSAMVILNLILHIYDLDILPNKQLRQTLFEKGGTNQFKKLLTAFERKPIELAYQNISVSLYAKPTLPEDRMDNNNPPTDLSRTHPWTGPQRHIRR